MSTLQALYIIIKITILCVLSYVCAIIFFHNCISMLDYLKHMHNIPGRGKHATCVLWSYDFHENAITCILDLTKVLWPSCFCIPKSHERPMDQFHIGIFESLTYIRSIDHFHVRTYESFYTGTYGSSQYWPTNYRCIHESRAVTWPAWS